MLSDEENEAIEWLKRLVKINKRDNLDNTFAEILLNLIEKQQKEIELLKEENEKYKNPPFFDEEIYTSNDKIKAKIEELEIEQESNREDLKIAIDNLLFQNIDKIGNRISINMSVREILQSLLEKE